MPNVQPPPHNGEPALWLDSHPGLPALLLILLTFVSHLPQLVLPALSDPLRLFGALAQDMPWTYPFGHNFLDPFVAYTTQTIGRVAALDWMRGIVPWWNPYVGIGVPLAGQMQPSAFLLPFVLLLALPNGVVWLTISMQILAGLSTYALLRELHISRSAALAGGALYALNGTIAWVPGPAAVICTLAFLPLLLWGIERSRRRDQGPAAILGIAFGIGGSLLAGFPETAYMDGLLGFAWAFLRFTTGPDRSRVALRVIGGGILGLLVAAPQLIAFADEMLGSQLPVQHLLGNMALEWRALPLMLMPAIYGPPNAGGAGQIGGTWGTIGGYSGALILLLAVLGFIGRAPGGGLRGLLAGWVLLCLLKTFGFRPVVALLSLLPAMRQVAFFRYAPPSWELALVILAAYGLDELPFATRSSIRAAMLPATASVAISALLAHRAASGPWSALGRAELSQLLALSTLFTLALLVVTWAIATRRIRLPMRDGIAALAVLEAAAMFCLPQLAGHTGSKPDLDGVRFLQGHAGLSRIVSLGPLAPNYGAYFGIPLLNHNMSPVPQLWLDYIAPNLLPGFGRFDAGASFWPADDSDAGIAALSRYSANYQDMGVRYVLTWPRETPIPSLIGPTPPGMNRPLALNPGQAATVAFVAPSLAQPIAEVGVMLGTYGGTSNGDLTAQLCDGAICASATAALRDMTDNRLGYIRLDHSLSALPGRNLRLRIGHVGGDNPVAIWTWPPEASPRSIGSFQAHLLGGGRLSDYNVRLGIIEQNADPGWRKVFANPTMDIWEMPNFLQYMDATNCRIVISNRQRAEADCPHRSSLVRRELYMRGWRAWINGQEVAITAHDTVLQQVTLPAGHSVVTFNFVPPFMIYGWVLGAFGLCGLAWQIASLYLANLRRRSA